MSPYDDWQTLAWGASSADCRQRPWHHHHHPGISLVQEQTIMMLTTAGSLPGNPAGCPLDHAGGKAGIDCDAAEQIKIATRGLNFYYGEHQALFDNDLEIATNRVTAIIGPSGCGKSTHLRTYNRIFELYRGQTGQRRGAAGRAEHSRGKLRCPRTAPQGRHDLSEADALPDECLRQYRLRPEAALPHQPQRTARPGRDRLCSRPPCGTTSRTS